MSEKRKAIWVCQNDKCVSAWGGANPGSAEACIVCGTAAGEVAQQPKRKKQRQQKQQEEEEQPPVPKRAAVQLTEAEPVKREAEAPVPQPEADAPPAAKRVKEEEAPQ